MQNDQKRKGNCSNKSYEVDKIPLMYRAREEMNRKLFNLFVLTDDYYKNVIEFNNILNIDNLVEERETGKNTPIENILALYLKDREINIKNLKIK